MITLQHLLTTDNEPAGVTPGATPDEGSHDFLSLLAQALTTRPAQEGETPLTPGELKNATGKTPLLQTRDAPTRLADLLARHALNETSQEEQILPAGMVPMAQGDALRTLTAAAQKAQSKSELSDDDLAGLSALMAMLPPPQVVTTIAPPPSVTATASAEQPVATAVIGAAITTAAIPAAADGDQPAMADAATGQDKGATLTDKVPLPADGIPVKAAETSALKDLSPAAQNATTPGIALAPVMSNSVTVAPAASQVTSAAVISQPLGTAEWQQAISQHVTLFTRQGQQSAELRLHPEELGQVQISLRLDDSQAQLQMSSPHNHVRAALEAALPVLRTQLADNGIQLTQSTISSDTFSGQQHSSSQHNAPRSGQQGAREDENDELLPLPTTLQAAARGNGAVDIFA